MPTYHVGYADMYPWEERDEYIVVTARNASAAKDRARQQMGLSPGMHALKAVLATTSKHKRLLGR